MRVRLKGIKILQRKAKALDFIDTTGSLAWLGVCRVPAPHSLLFGSNGTDAGDGMHGRHTRRF